MAIVKRLRERPKSEAISRDEITYFRLAASSPRVFSKSTRASVPEETAKEECLNAILDRHSDEQAIIFCEFEETVRTLEQKIGNRPVFVVTGITSHLYNEEGLTREAKQAHSLAQAVELSSAIIPDDYEIVSTIEAFFCDPHELRRIAKESGNKTPWIGSDDLSMLWRQKLEANSQDLRKLISTYRA